MILTINIVPGQEPSAPQSHAKHHPFTRWIQAETLWHNAHAPRQRIPVYLMADFLATLGGMQHTVVCVLNDGGVLTREYLVWICNKPTALAVLPEPVQRVFTVAQKTGYTVIVDAPQPGQTAADLFGVH